MKSITGILKLSFTITLLFNLSISKSLAKKHSSKLHQINRQVHNQNSNYYKNYQDSAKNKTRGSKSKIRASSSSIFDLSNVTYGLTNTLHGNNHNGSGKVYKLTSKSAGETFFDDWDFFTDADPTHGMVDYQSADEAWKENLVSVGPSSVDKKTKSAVMRVDNKSWLGSGQHRKSVRLTSKKSFKYGLLVLDVIKIPFGCSTWPAFWTVGDNWPVGGEIDIVEGVNMLNTNQMTLHTDSGCNIKNPMGNNAMGRVLATNCAAYATGNAGCGVVDHSDASFGKPFNQNGGGVFVMEWVSSGISIWRFNRGEIPADLSSGDSPQPSSWSHKPIAHWSNNDCNNLSDQFSEHRVVFDITLCGDWAGADGVFSHNNTCGGTCSDAIMNPKNFNDAEWEVDSVRLFQ
ncbi:family 16 glycoside hydrolase [Phakopsora pachyrhizi]|nr:family 16 glycoside hydrolase [Phakopsora pachyrhizi]